MTDFVNKYGNIIKWASAAIIVAAIFLFMRALPLRLLQQALQTWIGDLGVTGPFVFGVIYALATVLFFPGSIFSLAAGAIFGLRVGFITASLGSTAGASLAFLIARYVARNKVKRMAESYPKFGAIDEAISEGGWRIVALLRLSPAVPFNLQNYLYGLTDIKFWPYVITSWLAMMPGAVMYVYLGHAASAAAITSGERSMLEWIMLGLGLAATIAVTVYITRLARKKLQQKTAIKEESPNAKAKYDRSPKVSVAAVVGYAAAALLFVSLAIISHLQSDALEQIVRSLLAPSE